MLEMLRWFHGLFKHFLEQECLTRASALAFTTVMAIVPLVVLAFYVLSFLPISQDLLLQLQHFIFNNFVASTGKTTLDYILSFVQHVHQLSVFSSVFLLVTAISMAFSVESSLNAIWRVNKKRPLLHAFALSVFLLIIAPIIALLTFGVSMVIAAIMKGLIHYPLLPAIFNHLVPFSLSFVGYFLMYKILPNRHVHVKAAAIGAVAATFLFEYAKNIFIWYLQAFPSYQIIYGALAAFPILLIWIYIAWLIFLFGATVSYSCQTFHA